MKLAEALRERKQLQIKMGTLRQKLIDNAIYQEGSKPVEDPAELLLKHLKLLVVNLQL